MADRMGNEIRFDSASGETGGYFARPKRGHGPGILVIQEWWGLVDHIRDVCDRFAREGFVALAPDVYRGTATSDPDEAGRLMMDLEIPRAAADLDGAVRALLANDAVEGERVGAIGFCMGGQLALYAATRNPKLSAVVDCYGIHPKVTLDLAGLEAAVLGLFAENDDFIPVENAKQLLRELEGADKRAHFEFFAAQHAFMNETRPDVYDAACAARAWNAALAFLRAELPG